MQHAHALKMLNFEPQGRGCVWTGVCVDGIWGVSGGGQQVNHLLPYCYICESIDFDM